VATGEFELSSGATARRGRRHGGGRLSSSSARGRQCTKGAAWRRPLSSSSGRGQRHGGDRRCGWWWSRRSLSSKFCLGAATYGESVALGRIDPDPGFRVAGKIEVLRKIMFVESGLRIEPFGSLYHLIPMEAVENLSQTGLHSCGLIFLSSQVSEAHLTI
jgi:hypothetical protein